MPTELTAEQIADKLLGVETSKEAMLLLSRQGLLTILRQLQAQAAELERLRREAKITKRDVSELAHCEEILADRAEKAKAELERLKGHFEDDKAGGVPDWYVLYLKAQEKVVTLRSLAERLAESTAKLFRGCADNGGIWLEVKAEAQAALAAARKAGINPGEPK